MPRLLKGNKKNGSAAAATKSSPVPFDTPEDQEAIPLDKSRLPVVIYPELKAMRCWSKAAGGTGPITEEMCDQMLGIETESQFKVRIMSMTPDQRVTEGYSANIKEEEAVFEEYTFMLGKEKVYCKNDGRNRPFDDGHASKLSQDQLQRNWAGPICMPGTSQFVLHKSIKDWVNPIDGVTYHGGDVIQLPETVNGEAIIIGRTGQVVSGQHRLIAFKKTCHDWSNPLQTHWFPYWPEKPVLETWVIVGVSESPRVLQTLDNVKPRSTSDVLFTSNYFRDLPRQKDRKRCTDMLASALAILWKRSDQPKIDQWSKKLTHSIMLNFLERHKKIIECVRIMFKKNDEKNSFPIASKLNFEAGPAAACLYLMGASESDINDYRNAEPLPSEKKIKWTNWKSACDFWNKLLECFDKDKRSGSHPFWPVVSCLIALVDAEYGNAGRQVEKIEVLCRAWRKWAAGEAFDTDDIMLKQEDYKIVETGANILINTSDFGGIDVGEKKPSTTSKPAKVGDNASQEEKDAALEVEKERRLKEAQQKLKNLNRGRGDPIEDAPGPLDLAAAKAAANSAKMKMENAARKAARGPTRKEIEAMQTEQARKNDEEMEAAIAAAANSGE